MLSCRRLGTGWAEDVSGVIRMTRGGAGTAEEHNDINTEGEWLYYIGGDSSVKVWGRGEAR